LRLEHLAPLRRFFAENPGRICDMTVGGTFIWRDMAHTEFAVADDMLFTKMRYGDRELLSPPIGFGDFDDALERIVRYCAERDIPPRVSPVSAWQLPRVLENYPSSDAKTDRAWTDYLYLAEDLQTLAGRKYSGQRNQINKFLAANDDWSFDAIDDTNVAAVRDFIEAYNREHTKDYVAYNEGNEKTLEMLDNMELYNATGGALTVDGEIIAVAVGEVVGDTLFVHAEKALTEYQGSYQMVVNQFAKLTAADGVTYINREEDDGVEGLRKSKLSYHPDQLLDKYSVTLA
jgi:hypothetical protein